LILTVILKDKQLFSQITGEDKVKLIPYEENKFFVKPGYGQVILKLNEKGHAMDLKFAKYEEVTEGIKIK